MALETATYLVSKEIALRSGFVESRHRTADGRFILNDRDLSCVRFTVDEYVNGLEGVEKITPELAKTLIRQNNYAIGLEPVSETPTQETSDNQPNEETVSETPQDETEETISNEDVGNVEDVLGDLVNSGSESEQDNNNNETITEE